MASGSGFSAERSSFVGARVPDEISKMIKSLNNINVDKATFRAIVAGVHCHNTVCTAVLQTERSAMLNCAEYAT